MKKAFLGEAERVTGNKDEAVRAFRWAFGDRGLEGGADFDMVGLWNSRHGYKLKIEGRDSFYETVGKMLIFWGRARHDVGRKP